MKSSSLPALATMAMVSSALTIATASPVGIRIQCDKPTVPLSPHLYGLFFEDINFGADGGLYAELVQNRSFDYYSINGNDKLGKQYHPLTAWEKVERAGSHCELAIADSRPINPANKKYLEIKTSGNGGTAGVANTGFDGIHIDAGAKYDFSFHARVADWTGDPSVTIAIELADGTPAGTTTITGIASDWKKYSAVLTADKTTDDARLVLTTAGYGTLAVDMVSLFPQDTYGGRKNGLRKDLVQALKDLNPKFLRFPGGCITHGSGLDNAYKWKDSLGDVAERVPNWNLWGYHQTLGLGYHEYFLLCEDLGMQPLPVMTVGVACGFRQPFEFVPMADLQAHIQDAIDLIEYANGPVTSKWGGIRAKMGHPKPFGLQFICLGNEEHDNKEFRERFPLFVDAIRKAHPDIKIIGTSGLGGGIPLYDLMTKTKVYSSDEHYYEPPQWFIANQHRFDSFDRSKPKVFIGEYGSRANTLFNAVAEAAFLTGVERNGDIVDMTCYAPLFARVGHTQWNPDLIYFDKRRVVRTPNYYVQQLFSRNKGDVYLANTVGTTGTKAPTISGEIGAGSWNTAIEVADVAVNGRKIDTAGWSSSGGQFAPRGNGFVQTSTTAEPAMMVSEESFAGDTLTYTLRARKTGGKEGFLIRFGSKDGQGGYWWNIGGWDNSRHVIEHIDEGGGKSSIAETRGSIKSDVWHDVKIVLSPGRIRCLLNGKQIHDCEVKPPGISVASSLENSSGDVIVKLVNPTAKPVDTLITLAGLGNPVARATLITLTGDAKAVNTIDKPDAVKPVTTGITVAPEFPHVIPATSVQFIRVKTR